MFPLGRRHFGFGSNTVDMEVLGNLIHKSLMKTIPREQLQVEEHENIEKAFKELLKNIVYWLQFSFNSHVRSIT